MYKFICVIVTYCRNIDTKIDNIHAKIVGNVTNMNRSAYFVHVIVLILATCTFGCSSNSAKVHEHDIPMLEVHTGEIVRHTDINIGDVWARPGVIGVILQYILV